MTRSRLDISMLTLKTGPVQARGPWKLDELCEDFHDSFGLLVRGLGLEPRSLLRRRIYCPIFLLLAVFDQDTIFVRSGAFTNSANPLIYLET